MMGALLDVTLQELPTIVIFIVVAKEADERHENLLRLPTMLLEANTQRLSAGDR
jgi:hypothetical protein